MPGKLPTRPLQRITAAAAAGEWERVVEALISALSMRALPVAPGERDELTTSSVRWGWAQSCRGFWGLLENKPAGVLTVAKHAAANADVLMARLCAGSNPVRGTHHIRNATTSIFIRTLGNRNPDRS
jgi:hypothetical protein